MSIGGAGTSAAETEWLLAPFMFVLNPFLEKLITVVSFVGRILDGHERMFDAY